MKRNFVVEEVMLRLGRIYKSLTKRDQNQLDQQIQNHGQIDERALEDIKRMEIRYKKDE